MKNRRYPSARQVVYSPNGMVATSQQLAAQAGLDILRRGGNAIDAALAAAMTLPVTEPCSNGIGGDAFAIVWYEGKLYGLNASGRAPGLISLEKMRAMGYEEMPDYGRFPVTVPGIPGAWAALSRRFGTMEMKTLAESAVHYAEGGYPVSPVVSLLWERAAQKYAKLRSEPGMQTWFDVYTKDGRTPRPGERWRLPYHAQTLRRIAETNAEDFYRGDIAEQIGAHFEKIGGFLRSEDLAAFSPEWVDPISVNYRGLDVWELPPNGQGIVALMALNLLRGWEFSQREDERTYHYQIEAIKAAFADAQKYVTDPERMTVTAEMLLSDAYAEERRRTIGEHAKVHLPGVPRRSDTVYLCTADRAGNMVSYIQSNYSGFGSGIVVPGLGIAMQNRGNGFSLDPAHDNRLEPGKRTYHTIIPGFLTKGGQPMGPFGMMGGFMQPQGHVQMVMNLADFGLDIQESIDAPRWQWMRGNKSWLEPEVAPQILDALRARGHDIAYSDMFYTFGRAQTIFRCEGGYMGATEPRADGVVASW